MKLTQTLKLLCCALIMTQIPSLCFAEESTPKVMIHSVFSVQGHGSHLLIFDNGVVLHVKNTITENQLSSGKLSPEQMNTLKKDIKESNLVEVKYRQKDDPMLLTESFSSFYVSYKGQSNQIRPPRVGTYDAHSKAINERVAKFTKKLKTQAQKICKACKFNQMLPSIQHMLNGANPHFQSTALSIIRSHGQGNKKVLQMVKTFEKSSKAYLKQFAQVVIKELSKTMK